MSSGRFVMSCTRLVRPTIGYYNIILGYYLVVHNAHVHYCIIFLYPVRVQTVSSVQSWFHCMHTKWVYRLALSHSEEDKWTIMMESKLGKPQWPSICKVRRSIIFPACQLLYIHTKNINTMISCGMTHLSNQGLKAQMEKVWRRGSPRSCSPAVFRQKLTLYNMYCMNFHFRGCLTAGMLLRVRQLRQNRKFQVEA